MNNGTNIIICKNCGTEFHSRRKKETPFCSFKCISAFIAKYTKHLDALETKKKASGLDKFIMQFEAKYRDIGGFEKLMEMLISENYYGSQSRAAEYFGVSRERMRQIKNILVSLHKKYKGKRISHIKEVLS